jgi:hypothetical protein
MARCQNSRSLFLTNQAAKIIFTEKAGGLNEKYSLKYSLKSLDILRFFQKHEKSRGVQ